MTEILERLYDLTTQEANVAVFLYASPIEHHTSEWLASVFGKSRTRMSQILHKLYKKGLIGRDEAYTKDPKRRYYKYKTWSIEEDPIDDLVAIILDSMDAHTVKLIDKYYEKKKLLSEADQ